MLLGSPRLQPKYQTSLQPSPPCSSCPFVRDGVSASEDVFENISRTDTNCYSSHPGVSSSPAQLPLNVMQPLHFSTNLKPEGNSTQQELCKSLSIGHALPSFPSRLSAQPCPVLQPPRDFVSRRGCRLAEQQLHPRMRFCRATNNPVHRAVVV